MMPAELRRDCGGTTYQCEAGSSGPLCAYRFSMRRHVMTAVVTAIAAFTIPGTSFAETETGTNGPDKLIGTAKQDELRGKGGKDTLRGRAEDDLLYAGPGDDDVFGGSGKDSVWSGTGDDWVRASGGRDQIRTQADRDTLQLGSSGPTRAWTGGGRDSVIAYDVDGNRDVVFCGPGKDSVYYLGEIDPDDKYVDCEHIADAAH